MRRKDREVADYAGQLEIIRGAKVCRIAMIDEGRPYLVPLNFGWQEEACGLVLYFHGAVRGKKNDVLAKNPAVCFEVDGAHKFVPHAHACGNGFLFESVVGEGDMEFVTDESAKKEALNCIMRHQAGKEFDFSAINVGSVTVFRLPVRSMTGKRRAQ